MDMAARMAMNTDSMTPDAEQMLILQNWFSPAFPVGAFSYSGGLETAIARGDVYDRDSLAGWLRQTLLHGSIFMDAVFLRATMEDEDVNDLCLALCAGAERYQETTELGAAFGRVMRETQVMELPAGLAYPVAVGMAARALALPLIATVAAFLQGACMNQISVAVRAVPVGQLDGQRQSTGAIEHHGQRHGGTCGHDLSMPHWSIRNGRKWILWWTSKPGHHARHD